MNNSRIAEVLALSLFSVSVACAHGDNPRPGDAYETESVPGDGESTAGGSTGTSGSTSSADGESTAGGGTGGGGTSSGTGEDPGTGSGTGAGTGATTGGGPGGACGDPELAGDAQDCHCAPGDGPGQCLEEIEACESLEVGGEACARIVECVLSCQADIYACQVLEVVEYGPSEGSAAYEADVLPCLEGAECPDACPAQGATSDGP